MGWSICDDVNLDEFVINQDWGVDLDPGLSESGADTTSTPND